MARAWALPTSTRSMLLCLVKGQSRLRRLRRAPMIVVLPSVMNEVVGVDSLVAGGAPVLEVPARREQPEGVDGSSVTMVRKAVMARRARACR